MLLAVLETYAGKGEETLYMGQARQGTRGNLAVLGCFVGALGGSQLSSGWI